MELESALKILSTCIAVNDTNRVTIHHTCNILFAVEAALFRMGVIVANADVIFQLCSDECVTQKTKFDAIALQTGRT